MKRIQRTVIGLLITLLAAAFPVLAQDEAAAGTGIPNKSYKSWSALPILMYDNDVGVGYGFKAKFVDYLKLKESFDLILFNSSKGERWYVFTFSIPDLEIRQRRTYGISFDLKIEYDRYLKYSFYGLGRNSREEDVTYLEHETTNVQLTLGHGFTPEFSIEASYVIRTIDYDNVELDRPFTDTLLALSKKNAPYFSLALRYDTSDSQIHPTRGFRALLQDDFASSKDAKFNRITFDFRKYMLVFGDKDVFAFRTLVQYIDGDSIPLFDMSPLGGGNMMNAMRGFGLNRFMCRGKFLANVEYRFPIWWRIGGNIFTDLGSLWPSLGDIDLGKTFIDYGVGLRGYLADFVVRVDIGFSKEGMRLYFNFGHIF